MRLLRYMSCVRVLVRVFTFRVSLIPPGMITVRTAQPYYLKPLLWAVMACTLPSMLHTYRPTATAGYRFQRNSWGLLSNPRLSAPVRYMSSPLLCGCGSQVFACGRDVPWAGHYTLYPRKCANCDTIYVAVCTIVR